MEDFGPAVYKPLARLADIVGIKGNDEGEKARAFIAAIHQMNKNMNIPAQIDVIKDKDVPQMVEWAMKEANPIYPVPVIWDEEQFTKTISRLRKPVTEEANVS
jgi:alcohol dehydrogenase